MKARQINRETPIASKDVRRIAALTTAIRIICITRQMQVQRLKMAAEQPPRRDVQIEFTGRVPFGFAFTEGHEAGFHVPSGHRFVIEHLDVSCPAKNERLEVQLVTQSRHMFRHVSLTCWPERPSLVGNTETGTAVPILVQGSTANTLLFSNGAARSSSTVPPDTYVQVWGYLEPTNDGRVLKQSLGTGVSGLPTDVVPGEEQ